MYISIRYVYTSVTLSAWQYTKSISNCIGYRICYKDVEFTIAHLPFITTYMDFHIYNTLTREKELFKPRKKGQVKIYSCWPTVYGDPHIGNLRAFAIAWLLGDTLRALGYKVEHTMNVTDVGHLTDDGDHGEDKMEKWSRKEWLTARDVARKYEDNFKKYIDALSIHFDYLPRATDHIQAQIDIVKSLEDKGYTYEIAGDGIYMDTSKVSWYGKLLPPKHLAGIQSGERVEDVGKKNSTDFALWKFSPAGEQRQMERESPRWIGFPGRHIECSAMARATLGDFIDIHTGGIDHVPIHHTNEIAQSECGFTGGKKRVNYRVHCQFLNIDAAKISKSLGNVFSLPDIQAKWFDALDLRYFYLQAHYRSFQDFTREALEAAKSGRKNLQKKIHSIVSYAEANVSNELLKFSYVNLYETIRNPIVKEFFSICMFNLCDDLWSVELLWHIQKFINTIKSTNIDRNELFVVLFRIDKIILKIGIFDYDNLKTKLFVHEQKNELFFTTIKYEKWVPQNIITLAHQRLQEKIKRNYEDADKIRIEIQEQWFIVEDEKLKDSSIIKYYS